MIAESIGIAILAFALDLAFGDPKSRYHLTAWIGTIIAKIAPLARHQNALVEKIGGILVVLITAGIVLALLAVLYAGVALLTHDWVTVAVSVIIGTVLLKSTIAIRGMERHALAVVDSLEQNNLDLARANLSMIVKRDTKNLDKNHVISGVLESIGENTVDGITGPIFYYAIFGVFGAVMYRVINTADSMIAYKSDIFKNIGWFTAKCDTILNYVPSRLTGLVMIISAAMLGRNWKASLGIMMRDAKKTASPNAGYPMAALAGALGTRLEKTNHYTLGDGGVELTRQHVISAVAMIKLTSILFFVIVALPIITILGWWIHA